MFNSMGSVDIYNELFDKYPSLLGGAIWEWQDQGIYNNRDPNHRITLSAAALASIPMIVTLFIKAWYSPTGRPNRISRS